MGKRSINGTEFYRMAAAGAQYLRARADEVNELNVFPVPDGDTGTNMRLTLSAGTEELERRPSSHLGQAAETFSKGLLMGARGNSGVILSQLFRGFAKSLSQTAEADVRQFAAALQQGVDTAYQAVVKPVEGTILTVAREAAKHAVQHARHYPDIDACMREVCASAKEALARTPELLPVLKQVGVVDAGGQGLAIIYEGFIHALDGESGFAQTAELSSGTASSPEPVDGGMAEDAPIPVPSLAEEAHRAHKPSAQSRLAAEEIAYGYCTEFLLHLRAGKVPGKVFHEPDFRGELSKLGDSLLVVADDNLVKVHIHAEHPGDVMNAAMNYGDLGRIKIENMREQHAHILRQDEARRMSEAQPAEASPVAAGQSVSAGQTVAAEPTEQAPARKTYGMAAVAAGEGISEILASLGVDVVIVGGQTMNPSTEEIAVAVRSIPASKVFVFPNNANIILAAEQAKELVDQELIVIPSRTVPQGVAAVLAFQENAAPERNAEAMNRAMAHVRSGQVTFAVRNSKIDGLDIKEGDFLGMLDSRIVAASSDLTETCKRLLDRMIESGEEMITIFAGEDAVEEQTDEISAYLLKKHPNAEVEIHEGGQPLYYYLFSVE